MKQNIRFRIARRLNHIFWKRVSFLVRDMALTGKGTDECLEVDCLPLNVNYYSPVPDISDLEKRRIWEKKSELTGIDFRPEKQLAMLKQLGKEFGLECEWPLTLTGDSSKFYLRNNSFSYGCASALHTMIRHYKPQHFIEIGSGHSSKIISKALEMNKEDNSTQATDYIVVDPYPGEVVTNELPTISRLLKEKVECVDPKLFDILEGNDILFVDSGHTVRTGSDINFIILEALPRLRPGVVVHFHDINLPYEYPKVYFTNPQFRMFWT
jgi:hypothetical protein